MMIVLVYLRKLASVMRCRTRGANDVPAMAVPMKQAQAQIGISATASVAKAPK